MDERTLNDLLECSVCLDRLDTSSKVLPCQHTFCRKCLLDIVQSSQELRCPECRIVVNAQVDELPPNVLLMRILEGMKSGKKDEKQTTPFDDKTTKLYAKAVYDYISNEPGDLTFRKGDLIALLKRVDNHWYFGECNGKEGVFPLTYVQRLSSNHSHQNIPFKQQEQSVQPPSSQSEQSTQQQQRQEQHVPQQIKQPQPQQLIKHQHTSQQLSQQIQKLQLQSKQPPQQLPKQKQMQQPKILPPICTALYDFQPVTAQEDGCLTFRKGDEVRVLRRVDANWAEGQKGSAQGIFPIAFVRMQSENAAVGDNSEAGPSAQRPPTPPASPQPYVALFPYKPQKADELELKKGGVYLVTEKCQDGWFKGTSTRSQKTGVFPGNYVSLIRKMGGQTATCRRVDPPELPPREGQSGVKDKMKKDSKASLMRRLASMKKSRSPPPPLNASPFSLDNPVFDDGEGAAAPTTPMHVRSGSCPSQLSGSQRLKHKERNSIVFLTPPPSTPQPLLHNSSNPSPATAAYFNHRKSSSLDASRLPAPTPLPVPVPPSSKTSSPITGERYRCIVPYPPNTEYELELHVDDIVYVHKKRPDGWLKGTLIRNGKTGLFPASFVQSC